MKQFPKTKFFKFEDNFIYSTKLKPSNSLSHSLNIKSEINSYIEYNDQVASEKSSSKNILIFSIEEGKNKYKDILDKFFENENTSDQNFILNNYKTGKFIYIGTSQAKEKFYLHSFIADKNIDSISNIIFLIDKDVDIDITSGYSSNKFEGKSTYSGIIKFYLLENSKLNLTSIIKSEDNTKYNITIDFHTKNQARIKYNDITIGGSIVYKRISAFLEKEHSSIDINGLSISSKEEIFENLLSINNLNRYTENKVIYKNILFDNSKINFNGNINISENADFSISRLESKNLILSDFAEADSTPSLEIKSNEVQASHASTTGSIDENQMFYLLSKGISPKIAKEMLIESFVKSFLNDKKLDNNIMNPILDKIKNG